MISSTIATTSPKDVLRLAAAVLVLLLLTNKSVSFTCGVHQAVCEVRLEIRHRLTMMKGRSLVVVKDGLLYPYDTYNYTRENAIAVNEVLTGDGWPEPAMVIAINDMLPGPTIEVHEQQTVRVTIVNKLAAQTASLHFHGQLQNGTPWMDGVAFVSQCPILPGQTFVHEFKAEPAGSFWYHSHVATQAGMGMYGAFIVHPREGRNPRYHNEFSLLLQDWNHDWDTIMSYFKMEYGMYVHGHKEQAGRGLSGVKYSAFRIQSILINGRGRHRANENASHNGAPLSTFIVRQGNTYRFRLIHSGSVYPFQVSVDGHRLKVIATDGMDVNPVIADSVVLTPGERYDFEIVANQTVGNYWIRVVTLEVDKKHVGEAILRYDGAHESDPWTQGRDCTSDDPCIVVNCPFLFFPDRDRYHCLNVGQLRSVEKMPDHVGRSAQNVKEYFMNFAFPGTTYTPASINGIQTELPHVSALTQPLEVNTRCPGDGYRCDEDRLCHCTSVLDLQPGEIVQMVFTNLGSGQGWDHPIHMHGHSFWVLKVGYPEYDNVTGDFFSPNEDVDCGGDGVLSFCNHASWSDPSWSAELGGLAPGLELDYPVRKDTVNVPTGGYVIVRIQADNPGLWPLHCHVSLHLEDGMLTLLNESYVNQPPPPAGFPQCKDFGQREPCN